MELEPYVNSEEMEQRNKVMAFEYNKEKCWWWELALALAMMVTFCVEFLHIYMEMFTTWSFPSVSVELSGVDIKLVIPVVISELLSTILFWMDYEELKQITKIKHSDKMILSLLFCKPAYFVCRYKELGEKEKDIYFLYLSLFVLKWNGYFWIGICNVLSGFASCG